MKIWGFGLLLSVLGLVSAAPTMAAEWTAADFERLRSLSLVSLPPMPPSPGNRHADDPKAADFGYHLFFDTRLSSNGKVACATCHEPARAFTDGKPVAVGVGVTPRNAPSVVGAAWNTWFFWDGRKDSMWSQALASMENPLEHDMPRDRVVGVIASDADYRARYEQIFGPLPAGNDPVAIAQAFANVGKAIEAYERTIRPLPSRFDRWVEAILSNRTPAPGDELTLDERQGVKSFIGTFEGGCIRCHNGPLLTNGTFHNIGAPLRDRPEDGRGRATGVFKVLADEFNCLSRYSDAPKDSCRDLAFARTDGPELEGAFKVPGLRNIDRTGPFMHSGQYDNIDRVIAHYRSTPHAQVGKTELDTATITQTEFDQIKAFLLTLNGAVEAPEGYLSPPKPRS